MDKLESCNYDIIISDMNLEDLDILKDNLITSFDNFWTYDILKSELLSNNSKYITAKINGEIVGFAGLKLILDEAEIMNIVVKKSFRCHGIASLLLQKLFDICNDFNISVVHLEVNELNSPAINLYEKFGFKVVGFRKHYYNDGNGAVLMKRGLPKGTGYFDTTRGRSFNP